MSTQPHEQTLEELLTAFTLLAAIASCTESELFNDWHQSLQSTINNLLNTVRILEEQALLESVSGYSAPLSLCSRSKGESNLD